MTGVPFVSRARYCHFHTSGSFSDQKAVLQGPPRVRQAVGLGRDAASLTSSCSLSGIASSTPGSRLGCRAGSVSVRQDDFLIIVPFNRGRTWDSLITCCVYTRSHSIAFLPSPVLGLEIVTDIDVGTVTQLREIHSIRLWLVCLFVFPQQIPLQA